jgi:hypothetical protein
MTLWYDIEYDVGVKPVIQDPIGIKNSMKNDMKYGMKNGVHVYVKLVIHHDSRLYINKIKNIRRILK